MKKKLLLLVLGATLLFTACGNTDSEAGKKDVSAGVSVEQTVEHEDTNGSEASEEGNDAENGAAKEEEKELIFPENVEDLVLQDNFCAITGEQVLYEDEDMRIIMTGDMQLSTDYNFRWEYWIPIRYELLNDSKPMFQVTEAVINDMVIEAGYYMGLYDYENNAEDVIILDLEQMYALQQMLKEPVVKKMQVNITRSNSYHAQFFKEGKVVKSEDCPESFEFNDRMQELYSDDFQSIYYGGYAFMDGYKRAQFLFAIKAHNVGDAFWRSVASRDVSINGAHVDMNKSGVHSSSNVLRYNYASPMLVGVQTELYADCPEDSTIEMDFLENQSRIDHKREFKIDFSEIDPVTVHVDLTEDMKKFLN